MAELDLIVADDFAMLAAEQAGQPYVKAHHRARLRDVSTQFTSPLRLRWREGDRAPQRAGWRGKASGEAQQAVGAAGQHNPSRKPPLAEDLPFPLIGRWLSAMLRVLSPQIGWLLHERDRVLCAARATDPEGYSEDRSLDIVSTVTFDLDAHLEAVGERTG